MEQAKVAIATGREEGESGGRISAWQHEEEGEGGLCRRRRHRHHQARSRAHAARRVVPQTVFSDCINKTQLCARPHGVV